MQISGSDFTFPVRMTTLAAHIHQHFRSSLAVLLTWLLLLRIVFPCMDSSDTAKMHALVQHFQEHRAIEQNLDWWTFLSEHYSPSSAHHSSTKHSPKHHSLPLHCSTCAAPSFAAVASSRLLSIVVFKPLLVVLPSDCLSHPAILYTSIFQPPKRSV